VAIPNVPNHIYLEMSYPAPSEEPWGCCAATCTACNKATVVDSQHKNGRSLLQAFIDKHRECRNPDDFLTRPEIIGLNPRDRQQEVWVLYADSGGSNFELRGVFTDRELAAAEDRKMEDSVYVGPVTMNEVWPKGTVGIRPLGMRKYSAEPGSDTGPQGGTFEPPPEIPSARQAFPFVTYAEVVDVREGVAIGWFGKQTAAWEASSGKSLTPGVPDIGPVSDWH
jgi:hypothetical protein